MTNVNKHHSVQGFFGVNNNIVLNFGQHFHSHLTQILNGL